MVKVTLIRPRFKSIWESLAIGYIASYLRHYYSGRLELRYFDGYFDTDEQIIEGSVDSDIVGFSCTSPQMKHALFLARRIKQENSGVQTVFGGHHPSALPQETLAYPQVDVVVAGEGEEAMLTLLHQNLLLKKVILHSPVIEDLNMLPFPDRKLIRQDRTLALTEKNDGERIASVLSGRGCLFHCIFCSGDHDVFGNQVRKRSVNNILDEMEQLVSEWKVDFIKFADAEINPWVPWVEEFCLEKIARKLTVPWGANIHAGLINKSTVNLMKKANCREFWVGVETGSPRILQEIKKGLVIKQVERLFSWAREAGIRTRAYFMVGFPSETREDFEATLKLAERLDADVVGMTVLCPFPSTELYDHERFGKTDWSLQDEYSNTVWSTPHFSNKELHELQAEFTEKFKDRLCFRQRGETK